MMTISYYMNGYFYILKLTLATNNFGFYLICNVLYFNSMKGYICVSIYTPLFLNGSAIHVFKVLTYPMTQVLNDDCKYIYFSHIGYIFPKINLRYFLFLQALLKSVVVLRSRHYSHKTYYYILYYGVSFLISSPIKNCNVFHLIKMMNII